MATATVTKYRPHPVAALFPMMPHAEIEAMARDIAENGQAIPIVVRGAVLIDGRNRLAACELADVAPVVEEWKPRHAGDTVEAWIISANLPRRHLTESQRAMAASDFSDYLREQRQSAQVDDYASDASGIRAATAGDTAEQATAAAAFSVSPRSVRAADKLKRDGAPALVKAVREGRAKVTPAAKATHAPKDEQARAAARGKHAVAALAKKATTRVDPPSAPALDDATAGEIQRRWRHVAKAITDLDRAMHAAYILRDKGEVAPIVDVGTMARLGRPVVKDAQLFDACCHRVAAALAVVAQATGTTYGGRR